MADLLFDRFQYDQTCKSASNSTQAKQLNPKQSTFSASIIRVTYSSVTPTSQPTFTVDLFGGAAKVDVVTDVVIGVEVWFVRSIAVVNIGCDVK